MALQYQDRLNGIIGPGQSSALGPLPTQPLTGIKIYKWSIKLYIYLLHWYSQKNQRLNIKKQAVRNIYRLAWGACMVIGHPGNCPVFPCFTTALYSTSNRLMTYISIKCPLKIL